MTADHPTREGEPPALKGRVMPVHDAGKQVAAAYRQGLADARRLAGLTGPLPADREGEAGLSDDEREALIAEAEIRGQMRHITAEIVRGDQTLDEKEEVIADLRARLSHVEAERDEAQAIVSSEPCYVTRSPEARCLSYIGGTFDNGAGWVESMCCLPCRLLLAARAAQPECDGCACPTEHDGDYGSSGHAGPCPPHTCAQPVPAPEGWEREKVYCAECGASEDCHLPGGSRYGSCSMRHSMPHDVVDELASRMTLPSSTGDSAPFVRPEVSRGVAEALDGAADELPGGMSSNGARRWLRDRADKVRDALGGERGDGA